MAFTWRLELSITGKCFISMEWCSSQNYEMISYAWNYENTIWKGPRSRVNGAPRTRWTAKWKWYRQDWLPKWFGKLNDKTKNKLYYIAHWLPTYCIILYRPLDKCRTRMRGRLQQSILLMIDSTVRTFDGDIDSSVKFDTPDIITIKPFCRS